MHHILKVREEWPGGRTIEAKTQGYILDRPAFLSRVLERYRGLGGERARDGVERIVEDGRGVVLTLTSGRIVRARHLIAADGANSMVRRSLFREEPPVRLWAEQHLVRRKVPEDTITFLQAERYQGAYRWEFPAGDLSRVGFPRGADSMENEDIVETHRRAIPMGGLKSIVRGNVYLTGDAAAMVNPLTAGGIRGSDAVWQAGGGGGHRRRSIVISIVVVVIALLLGALHARLRQAQGNDRRRLRASVPGLRGQSPEDRVVLPAKARVQGHLPFIHRIRNLRVVNWTRTGKYWL